MDVIMNYLTEILGQNKFIAEKNYKNITKYDDIKDEFIHCIKNDAIPQKGIAIESYTASDIHQFAPFMNYLGIYNFLINLREEPDEAKLIISNGFEIK